MFLYGKFNLEDHKVPVFPCLEDSSNRISPHIPSSDQFKDSVDSKVGTALVSGKDTARDGSSKVEYESDDSEANRSLRRSQFDGRNDLPEADQERTESKWKARQKWIRAVRYINADYLAEKGEVVDNEEEKDGQIARKKEVEKEDVESDGVTLAIDLFT